VVGVLERFNLSIHIMEAYLPGNPRNLLILKTIYLISMLYILAFFAGAVQLLELVDKSNDGTSSEPPLSAQILAMIR
jgi:hypothetical protein